MVQNLLKQLFARPLCIARHRVIAHIQRNQREDRPVDGIIPLEAVKLLYQIGDRLSVAVLKRRSVSVVVQTACIDAQRCQHHNDAGIVGHFAWIDCRDMVIDIQTEGQRIALFHRLRTLGEAKIHQFPVVITAAPVLVLSVAIGFFIERDDVVSCLFQNIAVWRRLRLVRLCNGNKVCRRIAVLRRYRIFDRRLFGIRKVDSLTRCGIYGCEFGGHNRGRQL